MRTIGEVAELAGMAVSSLHYYDRIGLLKPLARSEAGYRLYGREELVRLREILVWRRLGFPLSDIAALLDEPQHDHLQALERQLELASAQLDRFQGLTRGLRTAIAAVSAGGSPTEDDLFAGFARSLVDDHDQGDHDRPEHEFLAQAPQPSIPTFSRLSGRSPSASTEAAEEVPRRIVATDPIRLAENLLALGMTPVGTGTYEDRYTGQAGAWTWSPLVEPAVRARIHDVGHYGSDGDRIAALAPDLILDLAAPWLGRPMGSLAESVSGGRFDHERLSTIAPTVLLPYEPDWGRPDAVAGLPFVRELLLRVGETVGRAELAAWLVATWDARVGAVRALLAGREVAMLASWGERSIWGDAFYLPTDHHLCQVFDALGLSLVVPEGAERRRFAYAFDEGQIPELEAEALFVHTRHIPAQRVRALLGGRLVSRLSAARRGRVFELGWEFVNSGWFGAHWQLRRVAAAFGVTQLLARGSCNRLIVVTVDARRGAVALVCVDGTATVRLAGPDLYEPGLPLMAGQALVLDVSRDVAFALGEIPEAFAISFEDGDEATVTRDRESARIRARASAQPLPLLTHAAADGGQVRPDAANRSPALTGSRRGSSKEDDTHDTISR